MNVGARRGLEAEFAIQLEGRAHADGGSGTCLVAVERIARHSDHDMRPAHEVVIRHAHSQFPIVHIDLDEVIVFAVHAHRHRGVARRNVAEDDAAAHVHRFEVRQIVHRVGVGAVGIGGVGREIGAIFAGRFVVDVACVGRLANVQARSAEHQRSRKECGGKQYHFHRDKWEDKGETSGERGSESTDSWGRHLFVDELLQAIGDLFHRNAEQIHLFRQLLEHSVEHIVRT